MGSIRFGSRLVGLVIVGVCYLPPCSRLAAQEKQHVPKVVVDGLVALVGQGHGAALALWTRAWPTDELADKRQVLEKGFEDILAGAGKPIGHDIVTIFSVSPSVLKVFVVVRHTIQPVFLVLTVYRAQQEWEVLNILANTEAEKVFPPSLVSPP